MDIIEELTKRLGDFAGELKTAVEQARTDRTCPECFCLVAPENRDKHVAALHADKSPGVDDATV